MRTLTYSLVVVVLLATVGLGWLFDQLYEQYSARDQTQDVDKVKIIEQLGAELAITLAHLSNRHEFVRQWSEGQQQYQLNLTPVKSLPMPSALLKQVKQGQPLLLESNEHLTFHYYLSATDEIMTLTAPLLNFKVADQASEYLFTILFYLALLSMFLLWVYPLVKQLLALRKAAKSFGAGNLEQRISLGSISYIGDIETEFNHMAQRIEDLVSDVKLLSSAVSHDLRTPLARIRFGIDTLAEEEDPILRERYQQKLSNNVDEMTRLVETLLTYARLDQGMLDINKSAVDIATVMATCINHGFSEMADIQLQTLPGQYALTSDESYMIMLCNNLLQNAVKYGNGKVRVRLEQIKNTVIITIDDNGEGIDEEERIDILKPFVRGKKKQQQSGHGIGLAMVKRIIDWHHGQIEISDSTVLSGAQFKIILPAN
ncbi:sensor histidine kinase [Thalassotalea sp. ND16A]|uniref:sensor histidine kinase n=1 Tax=Thalassotalea sp. ND16A TaxID=1535422 RepID=UPI00051A3668|nr:ATP-binding protein [Thalassotalea sp. ND16A]KGJ92447.1 hypothetical protein ND16A_1625 [Thalassotalea sp. ND16A]